MFHLADEASVVSNISPKHYGVRALMFDIDLVRDADEEQMLRERLGKWGVM